MASKPTKCKCGIVDLKTPGTRYTSVLGPGRSDNHTVHGCFEFTYIPGPRGAARTPQDFGMRWGKSKLGTAGGDRFPDVRIRHIV